MKARITQLIARAIGAGALVLAAKLGLSEEQQATVAQYVGELAAWLVAAGAFALDLIIHRLSTGGITTPAGTPGSAKLRSSTLPALLLAALGCAAQGCAATAEARYYQQMSLANHTRAAILAQHRAGNVSDATLIELDTWEKAWRAALEATRTQIDQGAGETVLRGMLDAADAVAGELIRYLEQLESKGTSDATGNRAGDANTSPSGDSVGPAADRPGLRAGRAGQTQRPTHTRTDRADRTPATQHATAVGRRGRRSQGATDPRKSRPRNPRNPRTLIANTWRAMRT